MDFFNDHGRSHLIQMTTLVWLRWCAVVGQTMAVLVGVAVFDLDLPLGPIVATIATLLVGNFVFQTVYPRSQNADTAGVSMFLISDIVQLGVLLALTGGLNNPFALLILAPVLVAAGVLPLRFAGVAALLALCLIALMGLAFVPLQNHAGLILSLPPALRFGVWAALSLGVVFIGAYVRQVSVEIQRMTDALTATQAALAREQKLTDLGGIVAATAHEMGTPLATIKLASSELRDELRDQPELQADAALIFDQANRCRDILHAMGHNLESDEIVKTLPLQTLIEEAAVPHQRRGKVVSILLAPQSSPADPKAQPMIDRVPETLHGLRNLIQNAVDHAKSEVEVTLFWDKTQYSVSVRDDGPGFPPPLLGRLGEPLPRRRRAGAQYEGLGLGLFIAKTLLGRTGAALEFANGTGSRQGAIVRAVWHKN